MMELLVFDCDGVLVDSEPLATRALRDVLVAAGVPATSAMIARCFGMKQADILASVARDTGVVVPPEVADLLWPATRRVFEAELQPMPGIALFLDAMGSGRRCVASSSSPERIRASLALTGLTRFFGDDVFSSRQVARGKPAPDLFLLAAERMRVEPSRALVIEDSIYGVMGARAAGMRAFGFVGGGHIEAGHAERLLDAGAEVVESSWEALATHLLG